MGGRGFAVPVRVRVLAFVFALAALCPAPALPQAGSSDRPLASISIDVQTFGRPKADFPATIQIHSSALESDLSSTHDKPSKIDFPNLPPGDYRITVTAPSREPALVDFDLPPGQSAKLSLIVDRIFPLVLQLDATVAVRPASTPEPSPLLPASTPSVAADPPASPTSPSSATHDIPSPAPSDVPAPQPFVGPCSVADVIPRVSAHVQQFVESINRITATELMNFERRNRKGRFEEDAKAKASYVAVIQPLENGYLSVEEFRNGASGMTGFQGHIASTGSIALVLIFHPIHLHEFVMTCQGLTYWQNIPVYEIVFQQRSDVPNTMSEFRVGQMSYDILLKGTAFIDAESFQVIHLETDLAKPIPDILDLEHQSVNYGAVSFASHNDQLWLPNYATITVRFRNKEFLEHHAYSDYRLFTVDTGQKISKPVVPASPDAPSPN